MENLGMTTTRVHFFFPKAILPHHSPVGLYSVGFVCVFFTWIGSEYKALQIIWLVFQPEKRAHGFPEALLGVAQSTDHHRTRNFARLAASDFNTAGMQEGVEVLPGCCCLV